MDGKTGRACRTCNSVGTVHNAFVVNCTPGLLVVELQVADMSFPKVDIQCNMSILYGEVTMVWKLYGVVYLGGSHFTCHYVSDNGSV